MEYLFRPARRTDELEMRFIADADSRIPLDFDSNYTFNESSVDSRMEYYQKLARDDFFEVAIFDSKVVAFHIVQKIPYPPNFYAANIITLWVDPTHRHKGLAAKLKANAEAWARSGGMIFMQTNVHKNNSRMMEMNQANGFEPAYIHLRKRF